jgi:addiction module HigA family antidote
VSGVPPIHTGEILMEEFLLPLSITQYRLAKEISVPPRRINEIVHGKRAVSADTALRLSRNFGTSERFWLNLQNRYDLEREKDVLGDQLTSIRRLRQSDRIHETQGQKRAARNTLIGNLWRVFL